MILLTSTSGSEICVNPRYIVKAERVHTGAASYTSIDLGHCPGRFCSVKETPEEIAKRAVSNACAAEDVYTG